MDMISMRVPAGVKGEEIKPTPATATKRGVV